LTKLSQNADDVIDLHPPAEFWEIGGLYKAFSQMTDEGVRNDLSQAGIREPQSREHET